MMNTLTDERAWEIWNTEVPQMEDSLKAMIINHSRAIAREIEAQAEEHRAVIEEAAQVLETAAAHNRANGRTVLERTQQDRANRLRAILSKPSSAKESK